MTVSARGIGVFVAEDNRGLRDAVCELIAAEAGMYASGTAASGFIGKGAETPELLRALRTVARGGRYVGPDLAGQLVAGVCGDSNSPLHGRLSEREFQIFCKLAQGEAVSQIAVRLFLSVKTVST